MRAAGVLEAVDRRDVGMVEGGEHLRFSAEPCDAITIKREGLRQDLQRDIAIELGVARAIDLVLHTWGQRLQHHPHVHCVVPAGGLSPDGTRWIHARPTFFLPVKVLRQVFRGKLVAGLRTAFRKGTALVSRGLTDAGP